VQTLAWTDLKTGGAQSALNNLSRFPDWMLRAQSAMDIHEAAAAYALGRIVIR
jgi:hypothetical protein